jgi:purine-binding chemotaxis protein CheW
LVSGIVHVRVRVGGEQYALPVEHVEEVLELADATPVPGSAGGMMGLQNLAGEIVPAFDLAGILQIERNTRPRRLVVVEHEGRRAALAVDEVIDVGRLDGDKQESESRHLLASTVLDGTLVGLLAVDVLFDTLVAENRA